MVEYSQSHKERCREFRLLCGDSECQTRMVKGLSTFKDSGMS
jgi:hypothetical protein